MHCLHDSPFCRFFPVFRLGKTLPGCIFWYRIDNAIAFLPIFLPISAQVQFSFLSVRRVSSCSLLNVLASFSLEYRCCTDPAVRPRRVEDVSDERPASRSMKRMSSSLSFHMISTSSRCVTPKGSMTYGILSLRFVRPICSSMVLAVTPLWSVSK